MDTKAGEGCMDVLKKYGDAGLNACTDQDANNGNGEPELTQLTVKNLDRKTMRMAQDAARMRGLRVSAWVRMELFEAAARTLGEIVPKTDRAELILLELQKQLRDISARQNEERQRLDQLRGELGNIIKVQHGLMSQSFERSATLEDPRKR